MLEISVQCLSKQVLTHGLQSLASDETMDSRQVGSHPHSSTLVHCLSSCFRLSPGEGALLKLEVNVLLCFPQSLSSLYKAGI